MGGFNTDFETGLLDDFDFTVTSAKFAPDARYQNGEALLLQLEGTTDSLDVPETHVWFSVGKGWVSKDGGRTTVHESGKPDKRYNGNSQIARLITRCLNDFNIGDVLDARGNMYLADTWVGLRFHMKSEIMDYGSGIDPKSKVMPVAYLGTVEEGAAGAPTAAATPAPAGETGAEKIARLKAEREALANRDESGDVPLKDRVLEVLRKHDNFAAAQSEALDLDGVTDDDEIINGLMDESGFWAEVNG
jgi:hypothetical protein